MKRFLTVLAVVLMCIGAAGQTQKRIYTTSEKVAMEKARIKADSVLSAQAKNDAKALKAIRNMLQERKDSADYANAVTSLEHLDFILQADKLTFKYGEFVYVTSTTKFISVKDDKAVVQVAPYNGGGPNGVGGITLDGRVSNITMATDKRGNITYNMNVQGAAISAVITITLPKNSPEASAVILPNFNSDRITLSGKIVPFDDAFVFKGASI